MEMVSWLATARFAGGVTLTGLNRQAAPAGRPAQPSVTALENPLVEVTVQVLVTFDSGAVTSLAGVHSTPKDGTGAGGGGGGATLLSTQIGLVKASRSMHCPVRAAIQLVVPQSAAPPGGMVRAKARTKMRSGA